MEIEENSVNPDILIYHISVDKAYRFWYLFCSVLIYFDLVCCDFSIKVLVIQGLNDLFGYIFETLYSLPFLLCHFTIDTALSE